MAMLMLVKEHWRSLSISSFVVVGRQCCLVMVMGRGWWFSGHLWTFGGGLAVIWHYRWRWGEVGCIGKQHWG